MKFLKRIFCKHEYEFADSYLVNTGMAKVVVHRCKLCGKEKIYVL